MIAGSSIHLEIPTTAMVFFASRLNHFPGGQFARLPARTSTPEGVYAAVCQRKVFIFWHERGVCVGEGKGRGGLVGIHVSYGVPDAFFKLSGYIVHTFRPENPTVTKHGVNYTPRVQLVG